jgi:[ribosomal protein S18]-alanine N-acetyltransferase
MSSAAADVRIRRMSATDLDRVMEIAASLLHAPRWPASAYIAAMNSENTPRRIALVAAEPESDTPAAFLVASLMSPEAELETIAVSAEGQRRGVGRLLLTAVTKELRVAQVTELHLEVRASNRGAVGFYHAQGFQETGRRARYYADPAEDAVLMKLHLG